MIPWHSEFPDEESSKSVCPLTCTKVTEMPHSTTCHHPLQKFSSRWLQKHGCLTSLTYLWSIVLTKVLSEEKAEAFHMDMVYYMLSHWTNIMPNLLFQFFEGAQWNTEKSLFQSEETK